MAMARITAGAGITSWSAALCGGGRFFGQMPSLAQTGNPNDAGYGQIIPTTGVDPYSATRASWFGVNAGGLADIFPNLGLYPASNLGFMA